ncbi:YdeI/OmpD-associated family protein [Fulvivirga ulvae]|uniref:YdeI/OmpD-associated family protein n=1 Tax=Fulvivirga ulvae TaxID=2904245 RepID=UPI001F1AA3A9|nr:YdeI/OmpD-associated family protein [Fulvivirga ulvae]UII34246.1 YdeI/OmpD-associated family protein [Fulvivirga ulvae]
MSELIKKLKYQQNAKALIFDLPDEVIIDIPHDSQVTASGYEFIIVFVRKQEDLAFRIPPSLAASDYNSTFWVAYPKKSSSIKTDISRDKGWDVFTTIGYRPVSQISINDTWSALRFKPAEKVKASPQAKTQTFEAAIQGAPDNSGGAWVQIPFDTEEIFGTKGQVKVKATFDGHPYQGSIANMGSGPILIIKKEIRKAINKSTGDKVLVTVEEDRTERKIDLPEELEKLLSHNPEAKVFYNSLSHTNRKEYAQWISSAKRQETKDKRLAETLHRLNNGIKNPFLK